MELSADNQWTHTFIKSLKESWSSYQLLPLLESSRSRRLPSMLILLRRYSRSWFDPVRAGGDRYSPVLTGILEYWPGNQRNVVFVKTILRWIFLPIWWKRCSKELTDATNWKKATGLPKFKEMEKSSISSEEEGSLTYSYMIGLLIPLPIPSTYKSKTNTVTKKVGWWEWQGWNSSEEYSRSTLCQWSKSRSRSKLSAGSKWTIPLQIYVKKKWKYHHLYSEREVSVQRNCEARNDEDGKEAWLLSMFKKLKTITPPSSSTKKPGQPEPKNQANRAKQPGKILDSYQIQVRPSLLLSGL